MKSPRRESKTNQKPGRLGVWLIGAYGGLATTLMVGTRLLAAGYCAPRGLITATEPFNQLPLAQLSDLIFGGHDIRRSSVFESAYAIHRENGTIPLEPLLAHRAQVDAIDEDICIGSAVNCGSAIQHLVGRRMKEQSLLAILESIKSDFENFKQRHGLESVVVVNLASTEPPIDPDPGHETAEGLIDLVTHNRKKKVRASTLYALAAIQSGLPFINFTPSNACLLPGHLELASQKRVAVMGNDGKTGETLMKSALAPMFKYRNLQVLTWQGYNILGDRDGEILADARNKKSKISTKDGVLSSILGYPLHTHVAIDYVPSLADMKTAWDFIHFQGFLDFKMSVQFTWQGCDAILAAPLVLDMIRFAELAQRRGESGLMPHLACFFKQPLGVKEHDLHVQFHDLMDYAAKSANKKAAALTKRVKSRK